MSKVIVKAHPETGNVLTPNTNKEGWSTLRLEEEKYSMSGRILNKSTRTAFVTGPTEFYQSMGVKANGEFPIAGKLVVKEQTTPFYEGQQPKIATNTDVVLKKDGMPIFRQVDFTESFDEQDILVQHDNVEEIKAAQQNAVAVAQGADALNA